MIRRVFVPPAFDARFQATRHYPPLSHGVAAKPSGRCNAERSPVVTGRKIGLQASGGKGSAKRFFDAGVMMGVVQSAAIT